MKIWFLKKPQAAVLPEGCEYAPTFNKADALWWPKGEVCRETDLPPIIICPNTSPDHVPDSYEGTVVSLKRDPEDQELLTFLNTITPTAEHTMGLIHAAHRCREAPPRMLSRMNLGIIGYGRIGQLVKKYTDPLFHTVYSYDVRDKNHDKMQLDDVLHMSDVITLHGTTEPVLTKPLLDRWAKPDRILINTAQPWLVDNWYLMKLLEEKRIWAAGLDYDPGYDALNLVYSNHVGGSTQDAWAETEAFVLRRALELWTS